MADSKISALGAASALAGTEKFAISDGTATSKAATAAQIRTYAAVPGSDFVIPAEVFVCLSGSYTLTSTTSAQKLFNASTNGTVALALGTYFFECLISLSSMSSTSGNGQFQILGGGTAVLGTVLYYAVGIDGATGTAATQTGSTSVASSSPASVVSAGVGTAQQTLIRGTFRVTTAGTIIPSIALVTAAAAVVAAGSYFRCYAVGSQSVTTAGTWT